MSQSSNHYQAEQKKHRFQLLIVVVASSQPLNCANTSRRFNVKSFICPNESLRASSCTLHRSNQLSQAVINCISPFIVSITRRKCYRYLCWRIDHRQIAINFDAQTNWWSSISVYFLRSCRRIEDFREMRNEKCEKWRKRENWNVNKKLHFAIIYTSRVHTLFIELDFLALIFFCARWLDVGCTQLLCCQWFTVKPLQRHHSKTDVWRNGGIERWSDFNSIF